MGGILNNKKVGNMGELMAEKYLLEKEYEILENNYRNLYGEIDIIAKKDKNIVFVEVKSRNSNKYGFPREAVDDKKIEKIYNTSLVYIAEKNFDNIQFRYDVIEIFLNKNEINHIENAFYIS